MTILESSLRNLVREEATAAAVKAIEAIPANPETLEGSREEILQSIAEAAQKEFCRIRSASKFIGREEAQCAMTVDAAARLQPEQLASYRKQAIELAIAAGATDKNLMSVAEKCARFIIDGAMDGRKWEPSK